MFNDVIIKKIIVRILNIIKKERKMDFSHIYKTGAFKGRESLSGEGSGMEQTKTIRTELPKILKKYQIKSLIDAPCGDFFWMRLVDLEDIEYLGIDIVEIAIKKNKAEFATNKRRFEVMNVVNDIPPRADMVFCRDLLVHLSLDDCIKVIDNFKKSGSKYLLTTTFIDRTSNTYNIKIMPGEVFWRPLNLEEPPFSFGVPIEIINEGCTEGDGNYRDKSLGLWLLQEIKL